MASDNERMVSRLMARPDVHATVVCDCGNLTFLVGVELTSTGENFIRALECIECFKQMPVPFQKGPHHV